MKLIDADELRWTNLQDGFGRINTCIVFESDINAMPTIEAIPVEWLLNNIPNDSVMWEYNRKMIEYLITGWREENEAAKV